jgi:hypothetical protein
MAQASMKDAVSLKAQAGSAIANTGTPRLDRDDV